jgi:PST family polysaccharide transporter
MSKAMESQPAERTHGQILKSSAWIGGSSVLNIAIGIIRTKAMAVLLNPAGFGLFGIYGSISSLAQSVAGMGLSSSGVRQIAHAMSSDDTQSIGRTAAVLRRTSILTGLLGAVLLAVFARKVSILTFGNSQHAGAIVLLSIAVFFQVISNGQHALIQGMRRIRDLAEMRVLGTALGALLSISLVYFLREKGVVPSLVAVALITLSVSWWYSRKIHIQPPSLLPAQLRQEVSALLKLGLVFMSNYFMGMGSAYAVRVFLLRNIGFAAAGYYQSASTMGRLYTGFVLESMGADFYPRLTACNEDNSACNRLINEQTQVGLLLAGPGVIATLTLAPVAIALFYSTKFSAAVGLLRWISLGAILQVITWPMSYMVVAKGKRAIYFGTEMALGIMSISLAWICVRSFGLNGAGIALLGTNVFHGLMLLPISRHLSGFRWSAANRQTGLLFLSLAALVFAAFYVLPFIMATCLGILAALLGAIYSIRTIVRVVPWARIPQPIRR